MLTVHGADDGRLEPKAPPARAKRRCSPKPADDAVLIASELASNAIVHSASQGEFFTVRAELYPDYVWVEAEDLGGPWHCRRPDDRPHGLDVIEALTGPDGWGAETATSGGRIVWARLDLKPGE